MKRAAPLVFSFSALSLVLLAAVAFVGTAAGTGAATPSAAELSLEGSASVTDHSPVTKVRSVTLTYTVTNGSARPVLAVTLHGALYQDIDTVAPTGSLLTYFDCPIRNAGGPSGLLWLGPGASAVCSATLDLTPGPYTAWLAASGYAVNGWPSPAGPNAPNAAAYASPSSGPTPEPSCPAISFPVTAPCPLQPTSAQDALPFYLLSSLVSTPAPPSSPPPSPAPSPSPSQSPSPPQPPSPSVMASPSESPTPMPTTPTPAVSTSPAMRSLTLERDPVPLPTRTENPTRMYLMLMVLPAVYAAAAVLARRR